VLTADQLRERCLELPGTAEEFPFRPELSVFKVSGKVFALTALDQRPLRISLKCEPGLAEQLRNTYSAVRPGYHLNKRHWNTVNVDGSLPDRLVLDMIEDSYDLVVAGLPKKVQAGLGWPPG
jgi:predicted DNA-binding protein (MmcQ/YjbR family)